MTDLELRLQAKLPGADTGIHTKNSFCDICAPGPHCGVTCYVKDGKIIKVEGTDGHPCNHGLLCPKGQANRQYLYRKDRIQTPLRRIGKRGEGLFQSITWQEAMSECAHRLFNLRTRYGASSVAFFSGYEKWYRPFLQRLCYSFGSVNYGTESSSCFTSSLMSWQLAAGVDCVQSDLSQANLFLGWAFNGYHGQYLLPRAVQEGKKRGMKVIIVDPRITPAVEKLADLHLRPRPGTDGALALALGRELIVNGWVDRQYIEENVYGFDAYENYVMVFTPEHAQELTGVSAEEIRQAAHMIHQNGPLTIYQSSAAIAHHKNGMQNHRAIMALSALTGSFNRPGGLLPGYLTYAHSNGGFETRDHIFATATRPVGAPLPVGAGRFPLWDLIVGEMQSSDLPRQILTGDPYPVRGIWAHGMNLRMFGGDRELTDALQALDFFVDIDLFLTDTAKFADIVLPACTSFERSEFKVYPGLAQYTQPVIHPLYESKSDTDILFMLADFLDLKDPLLRSGYDACLRDILSETGIQLDTLKVNSQWPQRVPCPVPPQRDFKTLPTPTGKFELFSTIIQGLDNPELDPLPTYRPPLDDGDPTRFPMTLVSGSRIPNAIHSRVHDVPWLRSMRPYPLADLSLDDARRLGIRRGDTIRVATSEGVILLTANPSNRIPAGTVFLYHGYREADVNSVVPRHYNDPYSGFPAYRSVRCSIAKEE